MEAKYAQAYLRVLPKVLAMELFLDNDAMRNLMTHVIRIRISIIVHVQPANAMAIFSAAIDIDKSIITITIIVLDIDLDMHVARLYVAIDNLMASHVVRI